MTIDWSQVVRLTLCAAAGAALYGGRGAFVGAVVFFVWGPREF